MEYLYLAMFLQEIGRKINEADIQKTFTALELEVDKDKVRFLIPALSILGTGNIKKDKETTEIFTVEKLADLENKFQNLKNSITVGDERSTKVKPRQLVRNRDKFQVAKLIDNTEIIAEIKNKQMDVKVEAVNIDEDIHEQPARYVYAIADKGVSEKLGTIGIDGAEVYTIPCKDMCIVVHDCSPEPYESEDEEVVKTWLFTQQEVLDVVADKFGVALPMSFDMIIEGKNGSDPEQEVKAWLTESYDDFYEKIIRLRNKQEYGVQIMLDTDELSKNLMDTDEKLRAKKKDIETKPQGLAYMEREILKDMIKEKLEQAADQYFREFYARIKKCTDDVVIGKTKKVGGNKQMIMNLSCLVHKDMVGELGKELEDIEKKAGVSVRFSGPWAPFSFVTPESRGEK